MLQPASYPLTILRGGTFETVFELFKNAARTEQFSLTGYTVELVIPGVVTLTSSAGLTITAAEGKVAVEMTPAQTALVGKGEAREWWLSITKSGNVQFPISGTATYVNP